MKRKLNRGRLAVVLGAVVALVAVAPALGGPSLKKLVKKEVARQIGKAKGPPGANGTNGVDGTARAYAVVVHHAGIPCAPDCTIMQSKGITNVTHTATGDYCVHAPGIDSAQVTAAVSVDWVFSAVPEGNGTALRAGTCGTTGFRVVTQRHPSTTVCTNATCSTTANVAGDAVEMDNVSFTIVIP